MLKNQNGFTLLDLMVSIGIIGVITSVMLPHFNRYKAKAMTTEAKVYLSSAYTHMSIFRNEYGMYASCLKYMGFDPSASSFKRVYAIGFDSDQIIDQRVYDSAVASGLSSRGCPRHYRASLRGSFFPAGKSVSQVRPVDEVEDSSIGSQNAYDQTFTLTAMGIISKDKTDKNEQSKFTIDERKIIRMVESGY